MKRMPTAHDQAVSRRAFMSVLSIGAIMPAAAWSRTSEGVIVREAAQSPNFLCNAVALTSDNRMFLGLPRWEGMETTPSLVRVGPDGSLHPFPGNHWNQWRPGKDPRNAFVMLNSIHIFANDSLWAVDQGTADRKTTLPDAQKVVQFDTHSGAALRTLRFDADILPDGGQLNDLRISGPYLYLTDSGLGGLIVHDLRSGRSVRRLSRHPLVTQAPERPLLSSAHRPLEDEMGKRPTVHSDMLEVTADGRWLYFCTPTGPLRRIETAALRDPALDDDALARNVETIAAIPTINGTAIDTLGNLYFTDVERRRIVLLTPSRQQITIVQDDRLTNGDAMFIAADRQIYIPCPQTERLAMSNRGVDTVQRPWQILSVALPRTLAGHRLGDAVNH